MKKIYTLCLLFITCTQVLNSQVTYTGKPIYIINIKRAGIFIGTIKVELFPNLAYRHVRNFDSLVSTQFYDSTAFHRVIPGFMIQGGDPNSRHGATSTWGFGQPGQPTVNAEFSTARHLRGILSAARSSNINSATSQFFICVATAASLNGNYSVYGRVISGMNIVDTIVLAPRNASDLPNLKHEMFITAAGSNDSIPSAPVLNSPLNNSIATPTAAALLLKWNAVGGAVEYEIEVSDDPFYLNLIKNGKSGTNNYYITNGLVADTKYYWHVRANNGGHYSDWSTDFMFSTELDAVGIDKNLLTENTIQAFPNPSTGQFTFSQLNVGDKVRIFDVKGKLVYETITRERILNLSLEGKEKGIYTYTVLSENKEKMQGKLILK
jgi:cyclophilin family peptidyl-prolyl cis-trans isomerase